MTEPYEKPDSGSWREGSWQEGSWRDGEPPPAYGDPQYGGAPHGYPQAPYGSGSDPQNPYGYPQSGYPPYAQPGYGAPMGAVGPPPESYMVWGILTTLFCCLPFGVVSIVKANSVNTLWAQGLFDQAQQASAEAKKWAIWSAVASVAVALVIIVFYVVVIGFALASSST